MSGVVGLYYLDGRPASQLDLDRMVDSVSHRGPDGARTWVEGSVGLGHLMLRTTPESFNERLPLLSRTGDVCVTADARIDNRGELIGLLRPRFREAITDGELILAAYERWGEHCAERILGDFAFALWDSRKRSLFCARDRFGVKPLFYYISPKVFAFASEIKALLCLPVVPRQINEQFVADHLTGAYVDREITFYGGIVRLLPAQVIIVGTGGARSRPYWSLDPNREIKLGSDEEYAEAFREKFTEAVRCRLRSSSNVGSMLSGGQDSSSIVCVARQVLTESRRGSLHTFSAVFDKVTECDERYFIDAVLAKNGTQPHYVVGDRFGPLAYLDRLVWHEDNPTFAPNLFLHWALYRAANEQGVRVLLDGFDGDSAVSHGHQYLNELAHGKRWLTLARETIALSRKQQVSPWNPLMCYVRHFGVNPMIARSRTLRAARRIWQGVKARSTSSAKSILGPIWPDFINPDFARRMCLDERSREWRKLQPMSALTEREGHFRILTQACVPMALETFDSAAAAFSIEGRYPFWDSRLVEFCLSLPPEQKLHKGLGRVVMRRALADLLPREVQTRAGKTDFVPVFYNGLVCVDRERLDAIVDQPEGLEEYLNPSVLPNLRSQLVNGGCPSSATDLVTMWRLLSLSVWLKHALRDKQSTKGGGDNVIQSVAASFVT